MKARKWIVMSVVFFFVTGVGLALAQSEKEQMENLGEKLMFDKLLSSPTRQACTDCHAPETGWTGPIGGINAKGAVYPGAVQQRFGNRKPPSAAYASTAPLFHYDKKEKLHIGGNFWDGRATGWFLGNPAADQAMGPFLNPVEQNNPDMETVVYKVCYDSKYPDMFRNVAKLFFEDNDLDICDSENVEKAYYFIAASIAVFEDSDFVNPFSSKFDKMWKEAGGELALSEATDPTGIFTEEEWSGLKLFIAENDNDGEWEEGEGGMCAACHLVEPADAYSAYDQVKEWLVAKNPKMKNLELKTTRPLFTDYTYDNLGTPKNPDNPFYDMDEVYVDGAPINPDGENWIDPGLAGFLCADDPDPACIENSPHYGKHKVPTLRNVDKRPGGGFVKAYLHNGVFKSLKEVVHFYNTRDTEEWSAPEVASTMNKTELGDLGLSPEQEDAIVAFMKTLSDGYF